MNGILIDKNNVEAFIAFPDGSITTVPILAVSNSSIGDTIKLSNLNINLHQNFSVNNQMGNDKLIDFF